MNPWEENWEMVTKKIGSGGQGTISIVSNRNTNEKGAMKRLNNQNDEDRRSRMYLEIAALIFLGDFMIGTPRVLDHNTDQFKDTTVKLYAVMDYIVGPTLDEYIKENGPMSLNQAIVLMRSLIKTVAKCHHEGIIHRDIKPDNIILHEGEIITPFLIDFGLTFNHESVDGFKTKTEQQMGNRFLLLPELTTPNNSPESKRQVVSDVTQLVGIFFFVLTGANPMTLQDEHRRMPHQRGDFEYKRLTTGPALDILFSAGFSYEASKRIQTAGALLEWLETISNPQIATNSSSVLALQKYREKSLTPQIIKENWQRKRSDEIINMVIGEFSNFVKTETDSTIIANHISRGEGGYEEIPGKFNNTLSIHDIDSPNINYLVHWIVDFDNEHFIISIKDLAGRETIGIRQNGNEMLLLDDAIRWHDIILTRALEHLTSQ